jgi:hypothetical protein
MEAKYNLTFAPRKRRFLDYRLLSCDDQWLLGLA